MTRKIIMIELTEPAKLAAHQLLPEHMVHSVFNYFELGVEPGSFLRAVLSNQLLEAVQHADRINKDFLPHYMEWLYNYPPGRPNGWGSPEAVDKWIEDARERAVSGIPIP